MLYITFLEITLNIWVIKISQKIPPTFLEATLLELSVTKKCTTNVRGTITFEYFSKKSDVNVVVFYCGLLQGDMLAYLRACRPYKRIAFEVVSFCIFNIFYTFIGLGSAA